MTKVKNVVAVKKEPHFTKSGFCSATSHTQFYRNNQGQRRLYYWWYKRQTILKNSVSFLRFFKCIRVQNNVKNISTLKDKIQTI